MIDAAIPLGAVGRDTVESWGRVSARQCTLIRPWFRDQVTTELRANDNRPLLSRGFNRSYGTVNRDGRLIATPRLDRFLSANWERGIICVEGGLSLDRLLRTCVPASKVGRLRHAQPVSTPGFAARLPPVQTAIAGLQVACFYYPEDRGISGSVRLGRLMAERILA